MTDLVYKLDPLELSIEDDISPLCKIIGDYNYQVFKEQDVINYEFVFEEKEHNSLPKIKIFNSFNEFKRQKINEFDKCSPTNQLSQSKKSTESLRNPIENQTQSLFNVNGDLLYLPAIKGNNLCSNNQKAGTQFEESEFREQNIKK